MYAILCSVILLAVLLSFLMQIIIIRNTLLANTEQNIKDAHQQSYRNLQNYLANIENVAYTLSYNSSTQRFFREKDDVERLKQMEPGSLIRKFLFMYKPEKNTVLSLR